MKVFITGISGTGKTSIAEELNKEGIKAIDMDMHDLCFWVNKNTGEKVNYEANLDSEFINSHAWICDMEKLKNMLNTGDTIVMLGHPENDTEIIPFFDKLILLQCRPEIFIRRILNRTDNDFGKDETAQKYLLDTYEKFENDMLKNGAISINAENSLEQVVSEIMSEIDK